MNSPFYIEKKLRMIVSVISPDEIIQCSFKGPTCVSNKIESIKSRYIDFIVHNMTVFEMCANVQVDRMGKCVTVQAEIRKQ